MKKQPKPKKGGFFSSWTSQAKSNEVDALVGGPVGGVAALLPSTEGPAAGELISSSFIQIQESKKTTQKTNKKGAPEDGEPKLADLKKEAAAKAAESTGWLDSLFGRKHSQKADKTAKNGQTAKGTKTSNAIEKKAMNVDNLSVATASSSDHRLTNKTLKLNIWDKTESVCKCHSGWEGSDCRYEINQQLSCSQIRCNARGTCVNGWCVCEPEWEGSQCERPSCPSKCNGRGTCDLDNATNNPMCVCQAGFTGVDCGLQLTTECSLHCLHGTCNNYGKCECAGGYGGLWCNVPICPGACSLHGSCSRGVCHCDTGFYGLACQHTARVCNRCPSENYTCNLQTGNCVCKSGLTGPTCEQKKQKGCPNRCSGNGKCDEDGEMCRCFAGWTGADCSTPNQCPSSHNGQLSCSGHGVCIQGQCMCDNGWSGKGCEEKEVCGGCSGRGSCNYLTQSCSCDPGYGGKDCELALCPKAVNGEFCGGAGRGTCNHVTGECECYPGKHGHTCEEDECRPWGGPACSGHGTCMLGQCSCEAGWGPMKGTAPCGICEDFSKCQSKVSAVVAMPVSLPDNSKLKDSVKISTNVIPKDDVSKAHNSTNSEAKSRHGDLKIKPTKVKSPPKAQQTKTKKVVQKGSNSRMMGTLGFFQKHLLQKDLLQKDLLHRDPSCNGKSCGRGVCKKGECNCPDDYYGSSCQYYKMKHPSLLPALWIAGLLLSLIGIMAATWIAIYCNPTKMETEFSSSGDDDS
eukprot:Platyproteum_vivax@DN5247_c0_g1_i2.p1